MSKDNMAEYPRAVTQVNRLSDVLAENARLQRKVDWMEGASLESVVTWNRASQHTLNMMCEAYQAGKQEVRETREENARLQARVQEAREHWRACETGWNKVIKQAEGFLRERNRYKALAERRGEALEEAQGKLEAIQALTLEPGHAVVDHITWHNALHRILRGSKEDERR